MPRLFYAVVIGLFGAGIVHIAVLFLLPEFSDRDAWSRLSLATGFYRSALLREASGEPSLLTPADPLFSAAACRFDLSEGPVHVTGSGGAPFWSASVYDRAGQNVYSFNDHTAEGQALDFVVLTPAQMINLRKDVPTSLEKSIFVETDVGEGIVVVRGFVPDPSWKARVEAFLTQMRCELQT